MKWKIPLSGHRRDFPHLPALFDTPQLQVVKTTESGQDAFHLESTDFDSMPGWEAVYTHAVNLLAVINGTARIKISGFSNVCLWWFMLGVDDDGHEKRYPIPEPREEPVNEPLSLNHDYLEAKEWLRLAREKPEIFTALSIASAADSWVQLYLVLDFIQEDVGGQKALPRCSWVTSKDAREIKRFTHTANNFQTLGLLSRHADTSYERPSVPMGLGEAKALIRSLLVKWLRAKTA